MANSEIDKLIHQIAKLPALGTRSARRIVLHLIANKEEIMLPLISQLNNVSENIKTCSVCGNFDTDDVCDICKNPSRNNKMICVVADVADLWAMERSGFYKGKYHVLGGVLSALNGILPEDLNIEKLLSKVELEHTEEVILALPATVDGQITAQYLLGKLKVFNVKISTLALGLPVGAELDYMDDGTLEMALNARKQI